MNCNRVLACLAACFVVSCDNASNEYLDEMHERISRNLADRFDVSECQSAIAIRGGRMPEERGQGAFWDYRADKACADGLLKEIDASGFEKIGADTYRYKSDQGWSEVITLNYTDDPAVVNITWENFEK